MAENTERERERDSQTKKKKELRDGEQQLMGVSRVYFKGVLSRLHNRYCRIFDKEYLLFTIKILCKANTIK